MSYYYFHYLIRTDFWNRANYQEQSQVTHDTEALATRDVSTPSHDGNGHAMEHILGHTSESY